jgi:hypothetical protein
MSLHTDPLPVIKATVTIIYDPEDYYDISFDMSAESWRDFVEDMAYEDFNGTSQLDPDFEDVES